MREGSGLALRRLTLRPWKIELVAVALMCAMLWGVAAPAGAAQSLETIELQHRPAEEIIPILEPLLDDGDAVTGRGYTLFVRARAANMAQLRAAVQSLDQPARQLLVSVRRGTRDDIERTKFDAAGTLHADRRGDVGASVTLRAGGSQLRTARDDVMSVSVTEGSGAFIASGTTVPFITSAIGGAGPRRQRWGGITTEYRDLTNGFLVIPHVRGENVVLHIEQHADALHEGAVETQRLRTQVTARLGEWVELGGVESSSSDRRSGFLGRRHSTAGESERVWVKVEVL
ncbi:MAG: hypothetical protein C0P74_001380 [Gammaproteobacteria bacterium]|nr:hypothetical protein [Gammaproteobacteria bacterium]